MADVLCFGNLQFDVLCHSAAAFPPPGQLQMIDAIDCALSGNGANVAAVLGRLGVSVELAGYSGADLIGEQLRRLLSELSVGTETLLRHPSAGTGISIISLTPAGERSILFVNGANALFDLDAVPDAWLAGRRVVSVGSLFVLPNFTGEAVGRLLARAQRQGAATVLNICWDATGRGLAFIEQALPYADYFVLSFDEGCLLTGAATPNAILDQLIALTPGTVILTLGADGCCWREGGAGGNLCHIPALPVAATDCTGAGDSFIAGLIAGLVQGRSLAECAALGCRVASYAVTGPGVYSRIPRLEVIDTLTCGSA